MKYTFWIILALVLLSGCVTEKSYNEQSKVGQFYHNLTSRYNGWFNANELVMLSIERLEDQYQDNYNELLPVYEYSAVDNADIVKGDLDEAIKKVSVVVTVHKQSDWVDDCYLLIGKSLYLKKDYEASENAFEYYMDEFTPDGRRASVKSKAKSPSASKSKKSSSAAKEANKRQKELQKARKKAEKERKAYNKELRRRKKKGLPTDDLVRPGTTKAADGTVTIETPETKKYEPTAAERRQKAAEEGDLHGVFLRASAYDEAILWLAKSYIERENWTSADYQFRRLEADDVLPKEVYEDLPAARAYYHIKRGNFPQVIPFLEEAIERASDRAKKARYSYIIAQLHYKAGDVEKAVEYYQKSLEFSNNYELEFNTELNIIRTRFQTQRMTMAEAQAALDRMVRDPKNVPYLGRIYYMMAQLDLENKDVPGAIADLEMSIDYIGQDKFQEVESQYLVATLYMQQKQYVEAEAAYKTCASLMKKEDPRYKNVKKLADNLTDIAFNLSTIALMDSLIRLSYLTPDAMKSLAAEMKKKEKEEAALAAKQGKNVGGTNKNLPPSNPSVGSPGLPGAKNVSGGLDDNVFWAFDQKNIKKTKREFERTWGDIALTDYWRVSSKAVQYTSEEDNLTANLDSEVSVYESEVEDYFRDVPKSDSARALCHAQIRKSMLLLGQLYRDRLEDFNSSIEIMEALLKEYPDAPEKMEAYYQLYLSALSMSDHAKAEYYKSRLIEEFPNSRFAKVLSDPNFAASQQSEHDRLVAYYDETQKLFQAGKHEEVLTRIREVGDKFGSNNVLMAKFDLLKAMSMGAQIGKEAYVDGLKEVIARYPNSPEEKKAKDMLLLLGDQGGSKEYGETGLETANFVMEENALHFVIIYVSNQDQISLTDTKIAVSDFNKKYFQLDNLKITSLVFDPAKNHNLVLVRSFNTKEKAMNYFETAVRHPNDFLPAKSEFEVYPITQKNYREVIKARSLTDYKTFFETNY